MLEILYRDEHLIAIDKPAGLLVHRSEIDRHETRFAVQLLRDQIGRRVQPVHRLDKGTSGVLLFAFDTDTTRRLGQAFENNEIGKSYRAVVRGWPPPSGRIDHPLKRETDEAGTAGQVPTIQQAVTDYRCLATIELPHAVEPYSSSRYALMALTPLTGRRHQLRRHLKHIAHPIIGDATHGKGIHNRFFQQAFGCHRLLLACTELDFRHPVHGAPVLIRAPLSGEFVALVERFGWSEALERAACASGRLGGCLPVA